MFEYVFNGPGNSKYIWPLESDFCFPFQFLKISEILSLRKMIQAIIIMLYAFSESFVSYSLFLITIAYLKSQ